MQQVIQRMVAGFLASVIGAAVHVQRQAGHGLGNRGNAAIDGRHAFGRAVVNVDAGSVLAELELLPVRVKVVGAGLTLLKPGKLHAMASK
ncbi:hypothetical protein D9M70_557610 [compost metagenome]